MIHVTDQTVKELLSSNEYVILDFGATWCGPCKSLIPVMDKVAKEFEGQIAFGKVDIEECVETTEEYGIRSVPTILFFKNGELVPGLKTVGAVPESKIRAAIDKMRS